MLKSYGWGGGGVGGGLCDYCVSPSPFGLDFGTLDFGTLGLGLTTCLFSVRVIRIRVTRPIARKRVSVTGTQRVIYIKFL